MRALIPACHRTNTAQVPSPRFGVPTGVLIIWIATLAGADPIEKTTTKGPVEVSVQLAPTAPVIGDPVTLTLCVTAEKDVELLMPDFGQVLERFAILDFTTADGIDGEGRTVVTQTYELQPPRSGRQSIPPVMIEFVDRRDGAQPAPEGLDAYELLTERLTFEVESVLPDDAAVDLKKIPRLRDRLSLRGAESRSVWPWIVAIAVVAVAAPFVWWLWMAARRRARRRSAYEIALARLQRLLSASVPATDRVDRFFVELSSIVRWYLETRFDLRAPELTTEEFLDTMSQSPDLTRDHQALVREFLRKADLVKFAHFQPDQADIDQSVAAAGRFLDETREDAPMLDQDGVSLASGGDGAPGANTLNGQAAAASAFSSSETGRV